MIPDWETNYVYLPGTLPVRYPEVWHGLEQTLQDKSIKFRLLHGIRDIWLRDFLPIQRDEETFVKFRYEPSYLRGYEHLITPAEVSRSMAPIGRLVESDINLDGGNIVAATHKVIMTDKVFRENPKYSPQELRRELERLFQVEECIVIPAEATDPIGHSDGILRFLDEDTVLINDYSLVNRTYGRRLSAALKQHHLECEHLPYFVERRIVDGIPSAAGCFINYLRVANLVIVPTFGNSADKKALRKLEKLLPTAAIVPRRCDRLAREGGVLNCISWGVRAKRRIAKTLDPTRGSDRGYSTARRRE